MADVDDDGLNWGGFLAELKAIDAGAKTPISPCDGDKPAKAVDDSATKSRPIHGRVSASSSVAETGDDLSNAERSYINKLISTKLVETKESDIELLRSDPSNPLHSAKNFQELNL